MSGGGPLGSNMPTGVRFAGPQPGIAPGWHAGDHPSSDDIATCVACGLCLPHCPTYRLTQEETASPRGRIAAMRAIDEGRARPDAKFMQITDLCLSCRACEEVCPSDVPFGRMMEAARSQTETLREGRAAKLRRVGLTWALPRAWVLNAAALLSPLARPFMPQRIRRLIPGNGPRAALTRLPRSSEAIGAARGTVALLTGCVQDRWFREVNEATIRVLTHNGWRVVVPREQVCCGALSAHYGQLDAARDMARTNIAAFDKAVTQADHIVVNSAGCSAHMKEYGHLLGGELRATAASRRVSDLMEFLSEQGIDAPLTNPGTDRVAYHDACHASRAQGIRTQPRALLALIPGLEIVEIPNGDTCCGAAGLYNVLEPGMASRLGADKAAGIASTGVTVIASANPGCSTQIAAHMKERGENVTVLHPVQLLDRAYHRVGRSGTP